MNAKRILGLALVVCTLAAAFPASAPAADQPNAWTIHFRPGVRFGTDDRTLFIMDFLVPLYQDEKNPWDSRGTGITFTGERAVAPETARTTSTSKGDNRGLPKGQTETIKGGGYCPPFFVSTNVTVYFVMISCAKER